MAFHEYFANSAFLVFTSFGVVCVFAYVFSPNNGSVFKGSDSSFALIKRLDWMAVGRAGIT